MTETHINKTVRHHGVTEKQKKPRLNKLISENVERNLSAFKMPHEDERGWAVRDKMILSVALRHLESCENTETVS